MSYQALYRVWRPQKFADLVGQPVITETLKNTIITDQISHAYLFAGPRGTGKTSAAKIFAKAVNCPNVKDGEPCNECKICQAITNGTLNDVIEIDAASNNGVDEIRDIRDKAKYAPTEATYKVYIIDEVHMLSTGAFNALLKTLEEPPANVIFILATTEPHKLPATIISRTQRFDFRRIQPRDILERMEYILNQKDVQYDDRALRVIAKAAEGGMRDALSILDQTMSYGDDVVTYENALQVTGSVTTSLLFEYVSQVFNQDVKAALVSVRKIMDAGKDASQFIEDLISYYQNILLYKQAPEMVLEQELGIVDDQFKQLSTDANADVIYQIIETLNNIQQQMRYTLHPDVYLEVLTVKIATIGNHQGISEGADSQVIQNLASQIDDLKQQINSLKQGRAQSVQSTPVAERPSDVKPASPVSRPAAKQAQPTNRSERVNLSKIYPILDHATRKDLNRIQGAWDELVQNLDVVHRSLMNITKPVAASDSGVVVSFSYNIFYQKAINDRELIDAVGNGLDRIIGYTPDLTFVPEEQWQKIRNDYLIHKRTHRQSDSDQNTAPQSADQGPKTDHGDTPDSMADDHAVAKSAAPEVVTKATELFGNDIVDVKND
ncbi:DNA polymerase III subunit gamma/tau [Lactobacillus sp. Sy-1]|uniref:DNA polymerase III subunit gamma/tau n=1 Tax=Lactobacillus sp. Sy-1 TaxID=2109645 RepID=UPI001C5AAD9F|nr:DNA polymerase III subunit gamma/tau [Lactobacillus sp. Sy-1]MBW1605986.1 DNA polymerase III subunit gamma/tau [Lactobacillus sp. Sy-1]